MTVRAADTRLIVDQLRITAQGKTLVDDVSFALAPGEFVAVIGPNGAGKSMMIQGLLGLIKQQSGKVSLNDRALSRLSSMQRAREIAYLPQSQVMAWPARVRDIVALGRFAFGASGARLSKQDQAAVDQALADCRLNDLAERSVDTLSGGELARVHMARAFCAQTPFLIADEPTASLDPAQTFHSLDRLKAKAEAGTGLLIVMHDIARAAQYADRIIGMKDGRIIAEGPTKVALTTETLRQLFDINATVSGHDVKLHGPR